MKRILFIVVALLLMAVASYAKRMITYIETGDVVSRTVLTNVSAPVNTNTSTTGSSTSVVVRQNLRQQYAYLYSKSDFEKAIKLSDDEFERDVNLRKDHKQQAEKFIGTFKTRYAGDNLMSAKASEDSRLVSFMKAYAQLKDNVYLSDIKHQIITSNNRMKRDYAKYSALYSSESDFVDAYLSEDFMSDVKGRE